MIDPGAVGAGTRLVLADAIYFKGAWKKPFIGDPTRDRPFHIVGGGSKNLPTMYHQFGVDDVGYREADLPNGGGSLQILALPYRIAGSASDTKGDNISFVVLLPGADDGLAALEKSLTAEMFKEWLGALAAPRFEVETYLPKFTLRGDYGLFGALKTLGMKDAFLEPPPAPGSAAGADFSGMNGAHDLFISEVLHQTYLEVKEQGTEAAAATVVIAPTNAMATSGGPPPPPTIIFRADHPFLFLICDNATGAILFMGRFSSPTE